MSANLTPEQAAAEVADFLRVFPSEDLIERAWADRAYPLRRDALQALLDEQAAQADALRAVYRERAHLLAFIASLFPSHIGYTDPSEPDWAVLIIETPAGQLSWHIAPDDLELFTHVSTTSSMCRSWDGHSTDEKYRRVRALTKSARAVPAGGAGREQDA